MQYRVGRDEHGQVAVVDVVVDLPEAVAAEALGDDEPVGLEPREFVGRELVAGDLDVRPHVLDAALALRSPAGLLQLLDVQGVEELRGGGVERELAEVLRRRVAARELLRSYLTELLEFAVERGGVAE